MRFIKHIIICFLLVLVSCLEKSNSIPKYDNFKNDLERNNLIGKIKTLTLFGKIKYNHKNNKVKFIKNELKKFNIYGNITEERYYDYVDESLNQTLKKEYDSINNLIKIETIIPNNKFDCFFYNETKIIIRNLKNKTVTYCYFVKEKLKHKTLLKLNEANHAYLKIDYRKNDTLITKIKNTYKNRNLITKIEKKTITKNKYDQFKRLIESERETEFGRYKESYYYKNMHLIKIVKQSLMAIPYQWKRVNTYDENFNKIKVVKFKNEIIESELSFKYVFDKYANWTKKIAIKNNETIYEINRQIKYWN